MCRKEGVPEGTYRLLTEAEWEYACRGGTAGATYFSAPGAAAWSDDYCGSAGQRKEGTIPNAWGLYGMADGVWEWCEDIFHDNYVGAPADGSAWLTRGGEWAPLGAAPPYYNDRHVIRGMMDWRDSGPARAAARGLGSRCVDPDQGFRVCRVIEINGQ